MQWLIDLIKDWVKLYFKGMIVLWSGAIVDIPDGWHLCDGGEGTPNLINTFVQGAGPIPPVAPGTTGGSTMHTHPFDAGSHSHQLNPTPNVLAGWVSGSGMNVETDDKPVSGTTDNGNNIPPFYRLAYIMKL